LPERLPAARTEEGASCDDALVAFFRGLFGADRNDEERFEDMWEFFLGWLKTPGKQSAITAFTFPGKPSRLSAP
jgi:hypothetical protein